MRSHPITTALALVLLAAEAVLVLAVCLYCLIAAMLPQPAPTPAPWVHPLAIVAEKAQELTCKQLRQAMPGKAPSKARKAELVAQLVAC